MSGGVLVALAAVVLAGCGGQQEDGRARSQDPIAPPAHRDGDTGRPHAGRREDELEPVDVMGYELGAGGSQLRLTVGSIACEQPLEETAVKEAEDAVTVTVLGQAIPREVACTLALKVDCVRVELSEPLGGRRVIDGGSGEAVPEGGEPFPSASGNRGCRSL